MAYVRLMHIAATHERTLDPTKFTNMVVRKSRPDSSPSVDVITMSVEAASLTNESISEDSPELVIVPTLSSRPLRPQYLNAYNLWHHRNLSLDEMCSELRSRGNLDLPLARGTVMYGFQNTIYHLSANRIIGSRSYIVGALKAQPSLPFSVTRLKALTQQDGGSWFRYRDWLQQQKTETRSSY
jgi:hypothetical protein